MLSFITVLGWEMKAETLMVFGRESLRVAGIKKICPTCTVTLYLPIPKVSGCLGAKPDLVSACHW